MSYFFANLCPSLTGLLWESMKVQERASSRGGSPYIFTAVIFKEHRFLFLSSLTRNEIELMLIYTLLGYFSNVLNPWKVFNPSPAGRRGGGRRGQGPGSHGNHLQAPRASCWHLGTFGSDFSLLIKSCRISELWQQQQQQQKVIVIHSYTTL